MISKKTLFSLSGLRLLSSVLGVIYAIVQVRIFGTSEAIEVYFAATTIVYMLITLTQSGQIAEVIIPIYHNVQTKFGKIEADRVFASIINYMMLILATLICIFYFFSPFIVRLITPGFSHSAQMETIFLFRVSILFLVLQICSTFFSNYLNANSVFGKVEVIYVINSFISLLVLIFFNKVWGVYCLIVSLYVGKLIEFGMQYFQMLKLGYRHHFKLDNKNFDKRSFLSVIASTLSYTGATQFYTIVMTALLSILPQGVYAVFKYVQQFTDKAGGIFVTPVSTLFFANYSKKVNSNYGRDEEQVKKVNNLLQLLALFLVGGVVFLGRDFLNLFWKSKNFNPAYLTLAYWTFIANYVGLSIYSFASIYRKVAVSVGLSGKLYFLMAIGQIVCSILLWVTVKVLGEYAIVSVILINSIVSTLAIVSLVSRDRFHVKASFDIPNSIRISLAFIFSFLIWWFFSKNIEGSISFGSINVFLLFFLKSLLSLLILFSSAFIARVDPVHSFVGRYLLRKNI